MKRWGWWLAEKLPDAERPADRKDEDAGGGEIDEEKRDLWTKPPEGMKAWIARGLKKKGGGST